MYGQPSGTDTGCIETASACWLHSFQPWPKGTARALPHSSARSGTDNTPVAAALTGDRSGRSTGTNQSLAGLVDFPTLTTRALPGAHTPAAHLSTTTSERGPKGLGLSPLAIQLKQGRVHSTRVLLLWHPQMLSAHQQRTPQPDARTLGDLLLPKGMSPGSTNLRRYGGARYDYDDFGIIVYLLQLLLIASLLALDRHQSKIISNECLQHAHAPGHSAVT